jgi:hypothetical protein
MKNLPFRAGMKILKYLFYKFLLGSSVKLLLSLIDGLWDLGRSIQHLFLMKDSY